MPIDPKIVIYCIEMRLKMVKPDNPNIPYFLKALEHYKNQLNAPHQKL